MTATGLFDSNLEHIGIMRAQLQAPPEVIGPGPEGLRVNFYITGGEVTGPKLRGKVKPVGADWFTIRADGVGILDVRTTIETHDGALIYVAYSGVGDLGPDGHAKFLRGELPAKLPLRTVPRMQTAHSAYEWVNRCQFLSIGEADLGTFVVSYDVYAVR